MSGTLILRSEQPVSRKDRPCIWCGESIPKGTQYSRVILVYSGDFQDQSFHLECCEACGAACTSNDPEFMPGVNPRPAKVQPPNIMTDKELHAVSAQETRTQADALMALADVHCSPEYGARLHWLKGLLFAVEHSMRQLRISGHSEAAHKLGAYWLDSKAFLPDIPAPVEVPPAPEPVPPAPSSFASRWWAYLEKFSFKKESK